MTGFDDKIEQYIGNKDSSKTLLWMFSGDGQSNDVVRKVLLLRLSPYEFDMLTSRNKTQRVQDILQQISSELTYPEVTVLNTMRVPHYSSRSMSFFIDSTMSFDNVLEQLNALSAGSSLGKEEVNG